MSHGPANILLTGGAGYIGSHTYVALIEAGHDVVILDNFENSRTSVLDRLAQITGKPVKCVQGSVVDDACLDRIFSDHAIDAVIHFAAKKAVGESTQIPIAYYEYNIQGLIRLLAAMERADIRRIVFSSSATVYGVPGQTPTPESEPYMPMNPYGVTKIIGEQMLTQLEQHNPQWATGILRYFNPAGAHSSGLIGEDPNGIPNNLMPYIAQVAKGDRPHLQVFGDDWETPDGTGVRDYIHVEDLARGHVLSVEKLLDTGKGHLLNLGTGQGYSVLEMLDAYSRAVGRPLPYQIVPRRAGDVPIYCAIPDKAREILNFETTKGVDEMCQSSWAWISQGHD